MWVGFHPASGAMAGGARGGRAERAGRRRQAGGRQPQTSAAQGTGARRAPAAPAAGLAGRIQVSTYYCSYHFVLTRWR